MQDEDRVFELINVSKSYGSTVVLKNVNLKVNQGDFISIRGKSGVGKTSLFRIMGLLELPTDGSLRLFGKDAAEMEEDEKASLRLRQLGLVFQFFNLLPSLTVAENVELPMALAGVKKLERRERVFELLRYFDLEGLAERFPESLSGGERQRVAVMRALVNRPRVLLADEPTSSLDDENSALLLGLLERVCREEKVAVVMTTTDLYENFPVCDDYFLKNGQLLRLNYK
ncbi:MAG: ABC transporter ATP-binding protein [Candidatus Bathyarchaeota archaeon]|nr:ABC transporter ATP-binding protein [Candidatus Bathyarchaeota archaeon]